jgi:glycerol-3-phosphate dehydrogenase (NAD(P)+)
MLVIAILLTAVVSYLLGSCNSAIIVGKLIQKKDIRDYGSHNAGLTNTLRCFGKGCAALTLIGDLGKGIVAVLLSKGIFHLLQVGFTDAQDLQLVGYIAGIFAILGHVFPLYYGFKGGKGVLVGVSVFLVIDWRVFCILIGVFAIVLILSKYVSLSSMIAAGCCPIVTFLMQHFRAESLPLWYQLVNTAMAALMGGWVIFMHRSNMERLKNGTENRFSFQHITILGSGGFGLSLALSAYRSGHAVKVWSKFPEELEAIRRDGEHKQKLPGVPIPSEITLTADLESAISGADLVIFGIPSSFLRDTAKLAAPYLHAPMVIVNTGKGLEAGTHYTMSQILQEELPHLPIVTITGPSHAEEVARNVPTTVVAASKDLQAAEYVQKTMSSETLRLYRNSDIIGCEVGGALKNIIALSAGICDGLGCGDNTKAALMTRGMHEITKLGVAMGGQRETFAGLSGIGDLIVTCCSMHSRNRRAGILIGEGVSPEEAVQQVGTVEGYHCCEVAYALAQQMGVSMPITEQLNQVLFHGGNPKDAIYALMCRPQRSEWVEQEL